MNKIETLKATIANLESGMIYHWSNPNNCNCGVIAKTLCNVDDLSEVGFYNSKIRSNNVGAFAQLAYCMTSNLPIPLVFEKLKQAGFTHKELIELEYLANERIADKIGEKIIVGGTNNLPKSINFTKKETLIKYLKAWVEILEEESNVVTEVKVIEDVKPVVREKTVYVSVPETITTLAEIILS